MKPLPVARAWRHLSRHLDDEHGTRLEGFQGGPPREATGREGHLPRADCPGSHRGARREVHCAEVPPGRATYPTCARGAVRDVAVEPGARVRRPGNVGPATTGRGSGIDGARVSPFTSITDHRTTAVGGIEYPIVLTGATIDGVRRVEASMIGRDAKVTRAPRVPQTHRLILGDHSKVQIRP